MTVPLLPLPLSAHSLFPLGTSSYGGLQSSQCLFCFVGEFVGGRPGATLRTVRHCVVVVVVVVVSVVVRVGVGVPGGCEASAQPVPRDSTGSPEP